MHIPWPIKIFVDILSKKVLSSFPPSVIRIMVFYDTLGHHSHHTCCKKNKKTRLSLIKKPKYIDKEKKETDPIYIQTENLHKIDDDGKLQKTI